MKSLVNIIRPPKIGSAWKSKHTANVYVVEKVTSKFIQLISSSRIRIYKELPYLLSDFDQI